MSAVVFAAMAIPASAQEQLVTSKSGIVTITLPSEQWVEGASDNRCAVFSNGTDYIAFNHYKVGEDLPVIAQPKSEMYESYQTITVQNGYYLELVGYCDDKNDFDDLKKAVNSAAFNMERMHADTHKMVADSMSVENTDLIYYCNADELNIRPDGAGNGDPIGLYHKGDQVHVTGIVKTNGVATGWVRVDYNGASGYVSDAFLVSVKPDQKNDDPTKPGQTGNSKVIYFIDSSSATIYEYTDGRWKDANGIEYWRTVEGQWASSDGATLYDYIPVTPNGGLETGNVRTIYWGTGNEVTIKEFSDGNWYDSDGKLYWSSGDGQWHTNQGETLYDDPDWIINHRQDTPSQEDYRELYVTGAAGGVSIYSYNGTDWYDNAGNYYYMSNGYYYDSNGNVYSYHE